MSHGPSQQASQAGFFGYGMAMPQARTQMSGDQNDMMSLMPSYLSPHAFDAMSMNLDLDLDLDLDLGAGAGAGDTMPQSSYATPSTPAHQQPSVSAAATTASTALAQSQPPTDLAFSPDDPVNNVPGAGPLPVTSLASTASSSLSTLTDFTKRRNWPAKVVEEFRDFLQILDANGKVRHVSPSIEALTGYKAADVLGKFLRDYIHPDDVGVFNSEFNDAIASGSPLRLFYRLKTKSGQYAIFESVGHAHIAAAKFAPNPNNQTPFCQAVFMMARPYPAKNAALLDSFLEHKMENERLRRRIADLRREEAEDVEESQRTWRQSQEGRSDITPSEDATARGGTTPFYQPTSPTTAMPPPDRPAPLNTALTRENLEGVAGSRPDSIREKMARYEGGATHADKIEMLTGLRYQEGERSRGITTGNVSPALIKGDAGIAIPMDRDPRTGEKKKKAKVTEEYVCTDCGTLESPEWRKGPHGPKTLCNACGLRWAKKEKKSKAGTGGMGMSDQGAMLDNME